MKKTVQRITRSVHSILPGNIDLQEASEKEQLREMLSRRCVLLNNMFLCTPEEVDAFKKVNDRLTDLTKKMHSKALSLYRTLLKDGYDPDFDDDLTMEATLRYVYSDEYESVVQDNSERNPYGSDFAHMLDILYDYYEDACWPDCAWCSADYRLDLKPDMTAEEYGLYDFLNNGTSWAESWLDREEFKEITICHAVHDLCTHKYYSIPDLLRMNDFWIEIKITHQHIGMGSRDYADGYSRRDKDQYNGSRKDSPFTACFLVFF